MATTAVAVPKHGDASDPILQRAAAVLRRGGLVAFPTETVYGLGANALDPAAVARIFEAKQRPLNDPLIVHVAGDDLDGLARLDQLPDPGRARQLMAAFWPGPLTLVLPRGARIPADVTAGLDKVAIRMPDHPIALALIRAAGVPVAAPSANRFGHVSPTTARHVLDDLDGRFDLLIDGGPTPIGVESTVLDLTGDEPAILRPGGIAREDIERALGAPVRVARRAADGAAAMPAPGMLDRHYAPRARLHVCAGLDELLARHAEHAAAGRRAGALLTDAQSEACAGIGPQFVLGAGLAEVARSLYAGLRALDAAGVDAILITDVPRGGLGDAIADRLRRAAAP